MKFIEGMEKRMKVSEIDMVSPSSLQECLQLLNEKQDSEVRFLAGGTDAVVRMKDKIWRPQLWINLKDIKDLRYIEEKDDGIHIGPMTTYTDMVKSPLLQEKAPLLVQTAKEVGAIQLQNMGTIGGNIGTASPAGDSIPTLYALDAQIELSSQSKSRLVSVEEFFIGPGRTVQEEDEMITKVIVQKQNENQISTFEKLGPRKAQSISIVNCAIVLEMGEGNKECLGGRIAFGSVGPTIVRAKKCEQMLKMGPLDEHKIEDIADAAWKEVMPISDVRASAKYRRKMASSLLQRGLLRLMEGWDAR